MTGTEAQRLGVEKEIVRLHDFFSDWFSGINGRELAEFEHSLDESFHIVSPNGSVSDKLSVVDAVKEHKHSAAVDIEIRGVTIRQIVRGVTVATYEEHQLRGSEERALISTVGLVTDDVSPGGYRWLFVHETEL